MYEIMLIPITALQCLNDCSIRVFSQFMILLNVLLKCFPKIKHCVLLESLVSILQQFQRSTQQ